MTTDTTLENWKSIGLDPETYNRLSELAEKNQRTMVGQIRWFIHQELLDEVAGKLPKVAPAQN